MRLFGQCHKISMIISCTVRVICYDNRNSPVTILTYMCITQDTFIDIVMYWYDHYCADANIPTLSYLPCWSYILSTIAFIMWKSFVCNFVLLKLNIFILAHNDSYGCFIICHVFYCILCCICIFYHVLCQKWKNKSVKSLISALGKILFCTTITYFIGITFVFVRRLCRLDAVTPVKYEHGIKYVTSVFIILRNWKYHKT